ncbi:phospholipase D-like domain-containing protein [uncultured Parolsenella sp.]|uniref:phospholipase D-like domain-containing protein n=1 Tax=uncultured Parolsenella sp. TaxID=2083008 RepID=UPI0025FF586B|nr:phospholipase D-like domain-containing protein [uncultured Parolsenella sp.]
MRKILNRILIVIPAIVLQVIWLLLLTKWLAPYSALIASLLSIVAVFLVLFIVIKRDESTYKLLWLLVILTIPLVGTLLYLCFGNKRTAKPLRRRLESVSKSNDPQPLPIGETPFDGERRMEQTLRWLEEKTQYPLYRVEDVRYYPLGDDMFPDMLADLRDAKHTIFVEYFIVEPGHMWNSIVEVLEAKLKQGVDVRVMYDDLGCFSTFDFGNACELQERGIPCVPFNPLLALKGTANYRDHRKMLIVDNEIAYSGGVNLADCYINLERRYGHWKDIGFRLTGEPVRAFTHMFLTFWNAFGRVQGYEGLPMSEVLAGEAVDAVGRLGTATAVRPGTATVARPGTAGCQVAVPADPLAGTEVAARPASAAADHTPAAVPSRETDGYVLSYYDSPLNHEATSNRLYVDLLSQSTEYAWFFTPYLMLADDLMDAMLAAASRGVDVRIIMPGIPDKKLVFRMSRSFYQVLLNGGVKIYEYTPGFVHAKGSMFDNRVATIGTVNLDYRSLFLHFENNSLFYRSSVISEIKADFLATQEKCVEIKPYDARQYSYRWAIDGLLRIFAPLC